MTLMITMIANSILPIVEAASNLATTGKNHKNGIHPMEPKP